MQRVADAIFYYLKVVSVILLAVMVVLVFGNVVLRYAFNSGITASEELARWSFVWLVFLGALIVLREHGHIAVFTIVMLLPRTGQLICYLLKNLMMLTCTLMLLVGSFEQTRINWNVEAPATGFSVGWFYGVGLAFGVPAIILILHDLWRMLSGRLSEADLIEIPAATEE